MDNDTLTLYRLEIRSDIEFPETLYALLHEMVSWGWLEQYADGSHLIRVHFPDRERAENCFDQLSRVAPGIHGEIEPEVQQDWSLSWRDYFRPVKVESTFIILPSWEDPGEDGLIPIRIEPKMAFGTGHHATTHLCLQVLALLSSENKIKPNDLFLDLGTGSGILGIGAAKLGLKGLGLDIDPIAVENARENILLNRVQSQFLAAAGSLETLSPVPTFELIMANILAAPLVDMAQVLTSLLKKDSTLVLSGLLQDQEFFVISAYTRLGFKDPVILHRDEWSALIWSSSSS